MIVLSGNKDFFEMDDEEIFAEIDAMPKMDNRVEKDDKYSTAKAEYFLYEYYRAERKGKNVKEFYNKFYE